MPHDLSDLVRRADEDRWLASRFAPADARWRLVAIYALNYEIARAAEIVGEPALSDIRLTWWRDAIDAAYAGKGASVHPALDALAEIAPHVPDLWSEIIEARRMRERFDSWPQVQAFVERTARAIMSMALDACEVTDRDISVLAPAFTDAALAWGYVSLARSSWFASRSPGPMIEALDRAAAAYDAVRSIGIPASAFPALGYVALVPGYLRALRRGRRDTPLLGRQFKLIAASATGRL